MEEKNELNDIILNKDGSTSNNKKIVLAVATLGVILIIVVMLMNSLTSSGTDNLPQAVLPPEPQTQTVMDSINEPLFEEVEVLEEESREDDNLEQIAQKLKRESLEESNVVVEPEVKPEPTVVKKEKAPVVKKEVVVKSGSSKSYYVQVGSFSKYEPNKKFLKSITNKGFEYKYHKVRKNSKTLNKVLVGPFKNEREARRALRVIRSSIEAGAFLTKL